MVGLQGTITPQQVQTIYNEARQLARNRQTERSKQRQEELEEEALLVIDDAAVCHLRFPVKSSVLLAPAMKPPQLV